MKNGTKKKKDYGESVRLGKDFMEAARRQRDADGRPIRKVLEDTLVKGGLPINAKGKI